MRRSSPYSNEANMYARAFATNSRRLEHVANLPRAWHEEVAVMEFGLYSDNRKLYCRTYQYLAMEAITESSFVSLWIFVALSMNARLTHISVFISAILCCIVCMPNRTTYVPETVRQSPLRRICWTNALPCATRMITITTCYSSDMLTKGEIGSAKLTHDPTRPDPIYCDPVTWRLHLKSLFGFINC